MVVTTPFREEAPVNLRLERRLSVWLALALTAAIVAAACGGGDDDDADEPTDAPGTPASIRIEATDNVYDVQPAAGEAGRVEAPADSEFEVTLVNAGGNPHDIDFYDEEGGSLLSDEANGDILLEGEEVTFTFTTPSAGTYYFVCSVHPTEMFGDFVVE